MEGSGMATIRPATFMHLIQYRGVGAGSCLPSEAWVLIIRQTGKEDQSSYPPVFFGSRVPAERSTMVLRRATEATLRGREGMQDRFRGYYLEGMISRA